MSRCMAQTRSPVPSPSRSGAGSTSVPGGFWSPPCGSSRIQATALRFGSTPFTGRAASQIGLPVDPSRRIRVSPVHSMKSALPGRSGSAVTIEGNAIDSFPSKRLSSSVTRWVRVSPRLKASWYV